MLVCTAADSQLRTRPEMCDSGMPISALDHTFMFFGIGLVLGLILVYYFLSKECVDEIEQVARGIAKIHMCMHAHHVHVERTHAHMHASVHITRIALRYRDVARYWPA